MIKGVVLTPLRIIENPAGDILHAMKQPEASYAGFGEAYFSTVQYNVAKGWKKHTRMVLNVIVPCGRILFVLFDGRADSETSGRLMEVLLSKENYQRLTVPPGVWMAFKGMNEELNMLLNIASIPHDPLEAENLPLDNDLIAYPAFRS
jgi:dTDP-4-dehydrorhamnose 3,5-epimerase